MTIGKQNQINSQFVDAYQRRCMDTVTYPSYSQQVHFRCSRNPFYLGLKLVEEAREYEVALIDLSATEVERMAELGDCTWYAAMLCNEFRWHISDLLEEGRKLLGENSADSLFWMAGAVAEPLGKLWRDGGSEVLRDIHLRTFRNALASTIAEIERQAINNLDCSFELILERNEQKLQQRKANGTLHGIGGDR